MLHVNEDILQISWSMYLLWFCQSVDTGRSLCKIILYPSEILICSSLVRHVKIHEGERNGEANLFVKQGENK